MASSGRLPPVIGSPSTVAGANRVVVYHTWMSGAPTGPTEAVVAQVSDSSVVVLGCPPEQLLGSHEGWLQHVHPDDRALVREAVGRLIVQRIAVFCDYRFGVPPSLLDTVYVATDETLHGIGGQRSAAETATAPAVDGARWVRDVMTPRLDRADRLAGWDGVVTEVASPQTSAGELRRVSTMFHALVSHLTVGVFFVEGPRGRPTLVNARARQLLGRPEDPGADLERFVEVYRLHRPDGSLYPFEELPVVQALRQGRAAMRDDVIVHRADGGRTRLATWAAPLDLGGGGRPDAAVWVLEARGAAPSVAADRAALDASDAKYRGLLESLPLMLVHSDRNLRLLYATPAVREQSGYDLAEVADPQAWASHVHADDQERARAMAADALADRPSRGELRYTAKDGSQKTVFAIAQPYRQDGEVVGVTTLMLDVTRERELERELERAQRLESIGRLSSGVVHDFNNLLSVIVTLTELARGALPPDHAAAADLTRVLAAAAQAAELAGQLLSYGRRGPPTVQRAEVDEAVRRTLELLRGSLSSTIQVATDLAAADLVVRVEETQLRQVALNLCLNARDAMPDGGRLTVQTAAEADGVRLTVADDGCGMSGEVRARIFDPFFSTKPRGSGLGLAVVRRIVEGAGGRVEATSEPGRGARFDVWLPAAHEDDALSMQNPEHGL
jgi:PAS domain S-box-containing protein